MADVQKVKILDVQTQNSVKNVKTLKQQIKELKDQLGQLEKGTEEYNRVAKQLADTNQKQIEVNEAMKYSNKDFGATMSNLTRVSAGVIGAFNGVSAAMQMLGADSEEAAEAMKNIQLTMAIIQGLSAIDTALKSLDGLTNAFSKLGKAKQLTTIDTASAAAAEGAETTALGLNTTATVKNNDAAKIYTAQQKVNAAATKVSKEAIIGETIALNEKIRELSNMEGVTIEVNSATGVYNVTLNKTKMTTENLAKAYARLSNFQQTLTDSLIKANLITNSNTAAKKANITATEELAAAEKELAAATGAQADAQAGANAGMVKFKNLAKVGWILLAVAAVAELYQFIKHLTKANREAAETQAELFAITQQAQKGFEGEMTEVKMLTTIIKDTNASYENRVEAIKKLKKIVPEFTADLSKEGVLYEYNSKAINDYNEKLRENLKYKAYQAQIEEYEQKQLDASIKKEEYQIKLEKGWFATKWWWRMKINKEAEKEVKYYEREQKLLAQMTQDINLENLKEKPKGVVKTLKEIIKEIKELYRELQQNIFDWKEFKMVYNGVYNETQMLFNRIKNSIKKNNLGKDLSKEFKEALENGLPDTTKYTVSLDFIFGEENINRFEEELRTQEEILEKMLSGKVKRSAKEVELVKKRIETIKKEMEARKALVETVQAFADASNKIGDDTENLIKLQDEYNRKLEIEAEYKADTRSRNEYASINKTINESKLLIDQINERIKTRKTERDMLLAQPNQTKVVVDRIKELDKQELDDKKALTDAEIKLDEAQYKSRLKYIELYYKDAKKAYNSAADDLETYRTFKGGGTVDYNTELDILNIQLQAIEDTYNEINDYYKQQMSEFAEGTDEWITLEMERQAALADIEKDGADKRAEIARAEAERKLNIFQTYTNALSSITGEIQGLLQEEMNGMDSNTKAYKEMRLTSARIDIASGILSAFMSGIQSGLPAPLNYGLAFTMATLVGLAGAKQLENIRNENEANAMSASGHINIGTHYDTLSYQTQTDILSAIQDSRVYVLESDITSTQRRVRVAESQSTF